MPGHDNNQYSPHFQAKLDWGYSLDTHDKIFKLDDYSTTEIFHGDKPYVPKRGGSESKPFVKSELNSAIPWRSDASFL